jgi:hypothetical protein
MATNSFTHATYTPFGIHTRSLRPLSGLSSNRGRRRPISGASVVNDDTCTVMTSINCEFGIVILPERMGIKVRRRVK